ncbi:MAG: chromosomal replication initiator protein DnaA [Coriobacteriia bacterium]|nr:chromosomal replication initiator protein DnaA [Coriobacteriia bacterium]
MNYQETMTETSTLHADFDKRDMDYLWEKSLELLESKIPESRFRSLFLRMSPLNFNEAGVFSLGVPNPFNQRLVEKTCLALITETLRLVSERDDLEVIVVVDESVASEYTVAALPPEMTLTDEKVTSSPNTVNNKPLSTNMLNKEVTSTTKTSLSSAKAAKSQNKRSIDFNDISLDPKFTFTSFVYGDTNSFAYTSALTVAESPGQSYNPLFIWGASGLGKTHLLQAIGSHVAELYPEKRIAYTTAKNFVDQNVQRAMLGPKAASALEEMRNHYRSADLLLVDDVQELTGEASQSQFFHTFNTLRDTKKQIVLVADRSPEEIKKLDERLTSRFKSGLMVDIQPPTYEMRCAILRNFIKRMNIPFTNEAIELIAEKSSDNVRELEGAVIRVNAWASMNKQPTVTLDLVTRVLVNYFPEKEARPISIPTIQKEVCVYYSVTHAELTGSKRKQEIVFPRHVAMYLCQELTESSLPQIGKAFGGKDHTTVMHAVDKIKKKLGTETETYDQIQYLTKIIRNKTM